MSLSVEQKILLCSSKPVAGGLLCNNLLSFDRFVWTQVLSEQFKLDLRHYLLNISLTLDLINHAIVFIDSLVL